MSGIARANSKLPWGHRGYRRLMRGGHSQNGKMFMIVTANLAYLNPTHYFALQNNSH